MCKTYSLPVYKIHKTYKIYKIFKTHKIYKINKICVRSNSSKFT